jgi:hypothetical protein
MGLFTHSSKEVFGECYIEQAERRQKIASINI